MKKVKITIASVCAAILLSGCNQTQSESHIANDQNSVDAVLQAGMKAESTTEAVSSEITTNFEETKIKEETKEITTVYKEKEEPKEIVTESAAPVSAPPVQVPESELPKIGGDMIDLSEMSATMVYSEVFAMMTEPEQYIGKTIKMTGVCNRYTNIETGADYYACIITDATACCSQGIEFKLPDGEKYPQMGTTITVMGTFGSYIEDGNEFYVLLDATLL